MGTGSQAVANRLIVNRLIAMHGLSSFCLGMVFPYTGIYIADRPGIGPRGVALYYALSGIANLAVLTRHSHAAA